MDAKTWNVIFLVDSNLPTRVVMLQRSKDKAFAPLFFTGIGGKIEEGETPLASAYRELKEETGITDLALSEFARCQIEGGSTLYYFWGEYKKESLPKTDDGTLYWVEKADILAKKIIGTTKVVCAEWIKRNLALDNAFTVFVRETGKDLGTMVVEVVKVEEGLK